MQHFIKFNRIKVGEKQLSMLITERTKVEEHGCETLTWTELVKLLNTEGPCIKTVKAWKDVNTKI